MTTNQFKNLSGILKFEYSYGRTNPHDLLNFNNMYFTCSPKPARQLSNDKLLFLVILDDFQNEPPKIIGRSQTNGFTNQNVANQQIIQKYPRLSHYKYYVDLINTEVIKGSILDGLNLYDVIDHFKLSMFVNTKAKNPYRAYAQQSYRLISDDARDYINEELEKIGLESL